MTRMGNIGWLMLTILLASLVSGTAGQESAPGEAPAATVPAGAADKAGQQWLVLVVGAPGEEEFGNQFQDWAQRWLAALAEAPDVQLATIGVAVHGPATAGNWEIPAVPGAETGSTDNRNDRQRLQDWLEQIPADAERVWVVLIGHGTADGDAAKFNLAGPDFSAQELNQWLEPLKMPTVIVNCASTSGAFVPQLKAPNRIVVASTKSGAQYNFSRFGDYLSRAIADPQLDLDKDHQTSLLEAFVAASRETQDFYAQEKRLPTELAILDDNGDGLGTPGDWYSGTRTARETQQGQVDGQLAARVILIRRGEEAELSATARTRRDALEQQLDALKARKSALTEEAYLAELEPILVALARLYAAPTEASQETPLPTRPAEADDPDSTATPDDGKGQG